MGKILYSEKHDKIFIVHAAWANMVEVESDGASMCCDIKVTSEWIYLGDL